MKLIATQSRKLFALGLLLSLPLIYGVKQLHLLNFFKDRQDLKQLLAESSENRFQASREYQFMYIAHAGGGLSGETYLNNLEAINNSLHLGVNFIELDFNYTADSVVVLAHDFVNQKAVEFLSDHRQGTRLTLVNLMAWVKERSVSIITDIKVDNLKILRKIVKEYPDLLDKIIPQAYKLSEISIIKQMGFQKVIFTNYKSGYPNSTIKKLASTNVLFGITLPYDSNLKLLQYLGDVEDMKPLMFTHTVNDEIVVSKLRESGFAGVYTDFLLFPSE